MRLRKYHVKEGFLKRRHQSCPDQSNSGCTDILREFALNISYINATNILGKMNAIKSYSGAGLEFHYLKVLISLEQVNRSAVIKLKRNLN